MCRTFNASFRAGNPMISRSGTTKPIEHMSGSGASNAYDMNSEFSRKGVLHTPFILPLKG